MSPNASLILVKCLIARSSGIWKLYSFNRSRCSNASSIPKKNQSTDSYTGLACAICTNISIWQFMTTTNQTTENNNLQAFYHECRSLIGYATHYLFCVILHHYIFSDSYWFKLITWRDGVCPRRHTITSYNSPLNFLRFFLV